MAWWKMKRLDKRRGGEKEEKGKEFENSVIINATMLRNGILSIFLIRFLSKGKEIFVLSTDRPHPFYSLLIPMPFRSSWPAENFRTLDIVFRGELTDFEGCL